MFFPVATLFNPERFYGKSPRRGDAPGQNGKSRDGDGFFAAGDAAAAIAGSSGSNFLFSPYKTPNDTSVPSTSALMAATRGPSLADLLYAISSCKNCTQLIATCDSDSGGLEAGAVSVRYQPAEIRRQEGGQGAIDIAGRAK
jgi:hypothetical protein